MSTDSALDARTIVIHQSAPNMFSVMVGDRLRDRLTADECLWTVASLLMRQEPSYGLQSIEEIREEAAYRAKRNAERNLRPFERLIKDKTS